MEPRRRWERERGGTRSRKRDAARRPGDDRRRGPDAARRPGDWDDVAAWYDQLVGESGSDYHQNVILPSALRLLNPQPGQRLLDLCCGQGVLARALIAAQPKLAEVIGVDASPRLIEAARRRARGEQHGGAAATPRPAMRFEVADACALGSLADGAFDAAACIMAVHDVEDVAGLFRSAASAVRPMAAFVVILMHPCFRIPRQSSWGWDHARKLQYRRLDRYAEAMQIPIATHPSRDASQRTLYFHRPLSDVAGALLAAGFVITAVEELYSHRRASPGGRSRGENRAATEFPLFLAMVARRRG
ncbi:MAG: class I SAM-dependent methyltransferase [Phycisphaerae bacterium]